VSQEESHRALLSAADAWRAATDTLQDRLRLHAGAISPAVVAREPVLAWVCEMPPTGSGDGRSWRAEPCHPFFGDGIAVHGVEDLGEAGERGAGGPFHQLGHLMLTDVPAGEVRESLQDALGVVRAAAGEYQATVRDAVPDLAVVAEADVGVLAAVQAIPAGQSQAGMSWRAEPRWARHGAAAVSVFLERDADDPRRAELVGLAIAEVPAPA
jgi:hypothetical protein